MNEVLEADENGRMRPVPEYRLAGRQGWIKRNFTLGNLLVIASMVFAGLAASGRWVRTAELTDLGITNRVAVLESGLTRVEAQAVNRETLAAKLDAISVQLAGMDKRLERVEQRLMSERTSR